MKFAVKAMADASARVVNSAGLTWDDIALVVPHRLITELLKVP